MDERPDARSTRATNGRWETSGHATFHMGTAESNPLQARRLINFSQYRGLGREEGNSSDKGWFLSTLLSPGFRFSKDTPSYVPWLSLPRRIDESILGL